MSNFEYLLQIFCIIYIRPGKINFLVLLTADPFFEGVKKIESKIEVAKKKYFQTVVKFFLYDKY